MEFSLRRAVAMEKTPSFIITQFGFTPDNMDETLKALDDSTFRLTTSERFATSFVLNALTATIAYIVDGETVKAHEVDGDWGNAWLRTNSAGSSAYSLVNWKANESYTLQANPDFWRGEAAMKRVVVRHMTVTGMILIDSALARDWTIFWNAVSHIMLPGLLLGYFSLAYISRMTRSFMIEELGKEYVVTARVKGLGETAVIWRHALGNVMIQLITVIALSYANLLEGSVLTETIFAWPGLGQYITIALLSADMNAVLGGTVVVGLTFVGLNMLSDVLYRVVDPRARG